MSNPHPKYYKCPPRMSDGRHFTDYRNSCVSEVLIQSQNDIENSYQYRQWLQRNGKELIRLNRAYANLKNSTSVL